MKPPKEKYIQEVSRITPPSSYQIGKLSGTNTIQIENIPLQYHNEYLTMNVLNLISKSENSLWHVNFQYPDEDEENKYITLKKKVPQNFHKIMSGFRSQIPFLPHVTPTKSIFLRREIICALTLEDFWWLCNYVQRPLSSYFPAWVWTPRWGGTDLEGN